MGCPRSSLALLAVVAACGSTSSTPSPSAEPPAAVGWISDADLEVVLEAARDAHGLPALAATVISKKTAVAAAATGVARVGTSEQVALTDRFHLGSCTKAMTATVVAMIVDQGTLVLDAPLAAQPGLAGVPIADGYATATLLDLLHHRGGLPANVPIALDLALPDGATPREARRLLTLAMLAAPPAQSVGEFVYSNAGYLVAGAILEAATNTDWETLMRTRLFEPLGMRSCGFGPPARVWGHSKDGTEPMSPADPGADNPPYLGPAATVHCTIEDWGRFGALHLGRDQPGAPLVSPRQLAALHVPAGSYAAGWLVPKPGVLVHDGSNTMWYARIALDQPRDLGLMLATNTGDAAAAGAAFEQVARELATRRPPRKAKREPAVRPAP